MSDRNDIKPPIVIIFRNPIVLQDYDTALATPGVEIFSWLSAHYPNGFGRPIKLIYNGEHLPVEESDIPFRNGDHLAILVTPAGPAVVPYLVSALISAVASMAATLIISLIFGRPKSKGVRPEADPVYSLDGGANSARVGEPVPVGYGSFITYPDYVAPPYSFYLDNQMYLDQVLCIGQGDYTIHDVLIEDTSAWPLLESGIISFDQFPAYRHEKHMGVIESSLGISERMLTSVEVTDIELSGLNNVTGPQTFTRNGITQAPSHVLVSYLSPGLIAVGSSGSLYYTATGITVPFTVAGVAGDLVAITPGGPASFANDPVIATFTVATPDQGTVAGPFTLSRPGVYGEVVYTDLVFPNGIYNVNEDGDFTTQNVDWTVTIQGLDDNGVDIGPAAVFHEQIWASTNTPIRISKEYPVAAARYKVKIVRTTLPDSNSRRQTGMVWTGLRFRLIIAANEVYGNTTLLAVRLRATSGISSDAARKIRVHATRQLKHMGTGPQLATQSPANAFIDAITNVDYGAGRPVSEIDVVRAQELHDHWGAEGQFNGIFTTRSTVWEALGLILQPVVCLPTVSGTKLSIIQGGEKLFNTQMFSSANMERGSFTASYSFNRPGDHKGVRVEYRSAADFSVQYEEYSDDPTAVDFDNVVLFGCTSAAIAQAHARLLWQRRLYQRQNYSFSTELEGMIPLIGEKIAIVNEIIDFSYSGQIVEFIPGAPNRIILDRHINLGTIPSPVIVVRNTNGTPNPPYAVTQGATPFEYLFAGVISDVSPQNLVALWAIGSSTRIMREAIVTSLTPDGRQKVAVNAIKYDTRVFDGTLAFLQVPI